MPLGSMPPAKLIWAGNPPLQEPTNEIRSFGRAQDLPTRTARNFDDRVGYPYMHLYTSIIGLSTDKHRYIIL